MLKDRAGDKGVRCGRKRRCEGMGLGGCERLKGGRAKRKEWWSAINLIKKLNARRAVGKWIDRAADSHDGGSTKELRSVGTRRRRRVSPGSGTCWQCYGRRYTWMIAGIADLLTRRTCWPRHHGQRLYFPRDRACSVKPVSWKRQRDPDYSSRDLCPAAIARLFALLPNW